MIVFNVITLVFLGVTFWMSWELYKLFDVRPLSWFSWAVGFAFVLRVVIILQDLELMVVFPTREIFSVFYVLLFLGIYQLRETVKRTLK